MEVYHIPHFGASVHTALFHNVSNAAALRSRLVTASTMQGEEGVMERGAVNFAFIDARLITSKRVLEIAIQQALLADERGQLRTKYIHSEILWLLNPGNNISEAIRRFGVADASTSLIVVRVFKSDSTEPTQETDKVLASMQKVLEGKLGSLDTLPTDWATIKKIYKLGSDTALRKTKSEEEEHVLVDRIVANMVAIKPVAG
ncbi:hypothetical protein FRC15_005085 [Serendipita sp. 397]|nr:hypothetical protein FRC15_005085 [Serendipita sp. 397]